MKKIFLLIMISLLLSCQTKKPIPRGPEYYRLLEFNMFYAIQKRNIKEVEAILKTGDLDLNPYPTEERTNSPLINAVFYGNLEIIELLVSYGADINSQQFNGAPAMLTAFVSQDWDAAEYLLEQGADVNIPDENGTTTISYLCSMGKLNYIEAALKNGARINESPVKWDYTGSPEEAFQYTAFQWAVLKNHYDVVELLLHWGGNPYVSVRGMDSFQLAEKYGYTKILQLLNKYSPEDFSQPQAEEITLSPLYYDEITEEELLTEIDITRMHHIQYYGELLQEYFQIEGKYPFQGDYDRNVFVSFLQSSPESEEESNEMNSIIPFKDFIKEIERVVKRDVQEYYDPISSNAEISSGYLYMVDGVYITLTAPLFNSYSFSNDFIIEDINLLILSNNLVPYQKFFTLSWLKNNEEFSELLQRPLKMGKQFQSFHEEYLYATNKL